LKAESDSQLFADFFASVYHTDYKPINPISILNLSIPPERIPERRVLISNQGDGFSLAPPDKIFPAGKRRFEVKLDSRVPVKGSRRLTHEDHADERTFRLV
jgi:hypothetical protein